MFGILVTGMNWIFNKINFTDRQTMFFWLSAGNVRQKWKVNCPIGSSWPQLERKLART